MKLRKKVVKTGPQKVCRALATSLYIEEVRKDTGIHQQNIMQCPPQAQHMTLYHSMNMNHMYPTSSIVSISSYKLKTPKSDRIMILEVVF